MHLTFANSDGLEQVATSVISSSSSQPNSKMMRPSPNKEDNYQQQEGGGGWWKGGLMGEDSDSSSESDYFVIDEASPLLVDLDPPGTETRVSYMGEAKKRYPNKLLSFRIRKGKTQRLPWVIVITAMGMAAMVLAGFVTMFQENVPVTNLDSDDNDATVVNVHNTTTTEVSTSSTSTENSDSPTRVIVNPVDDDAIDDTFVVESTNGSNNLTKTIVSTTIT